MKINHIKINGFGKIQDKDIKFQDGINLVYGENESGKSTILKYIVTSLYGISKNKNGKKVSDFEQYTPWENNTFSGKISYTLESGKMYEIFRDFKRKKATIYNEFLEDISKEFAINQSKQMDFLNQQIGVDEFSFLNTSLIQQQFVKLDKSSTSNMIQRISNLVSTGNDNISFKSSIEKINKRQIELVGTERTKQRPLNIVNDAIKRLEEDRKKLSIYKGNTKNTNRKLDTELEEMYEKKKFFKEISQFSKQQKVKMAELEFEKNLEQEYLQEVNKMKQEISLNDKSSRGKNQKFRLLILKIILVFLIIASTILFILPENKLFGVFGIILLIIDLLIMKRQNRINLYKNNSELARDYEVALKTYNKKKQEIESKQKRIEAEDSKIKKEIMDRYRKSLNDGFIENGIHLSDVSLDEEIENIDKKINELKLQNHIVNMEKENMDDKLEQLVKIEEDLEEQKKIKQELIELNTSFDIAKEALSQAYEEVKHSISPKFEKNLSDIIFDITDGKYHHVIVNDETGLMVELESGEYVPVDKLSAGTIDEMYFGLRLSISDEITQEKMPIILDETFAYFDDNRLKDVMRYLQDKKYDQQIIIFTCSKREEEALNQLKIEYNLINLEK